MDKIIGCKYCLTEITEHDMAAASGQVDLVDEEFNIDFRVTGLDFYSGKRTTITSLKKKLKFVFGFCSFDSFGCALYLSNDQGKYGDELFGDDWQFNYCPMCGRKLPKMEVEDYEKKNR